jgi:hypothetical protein
VRPSSGAFRRLPEQLQKTKPGWPRKGNPASGEKRT